jgi:hypothetical protein
VRAAACSKRFALDIVEQHAGGLCSSLLQSLEEQHVAYAPLFLPHEWRLSMGGLLHTAFPF